MAQTIRSHKEPAGKMQTIMENYILLRSKTPINKVCDKIKKVHSKTTTSFEHNGIIIEGPTDIAN